MISCIYIVNLFGRLCLLHRVTSRSSFRHCLNRERRGDAPNWRWHERYLCVIRNLRTNAEWAEREEGKRASLGSMFVLLNRGFDQNEYEREEASTVSSAKKRKNHIIHGDRSNERCRCSWNHSEQSSMASIGVHRIHNNAKRISGIDCLNFFPVLWGSLDCLRMWLFPRESDSFTISAINANYSSSNLCARRRVCSFQYLSHRL